MTSHKLVAAHIKRPKKPLGDNSRPMIDKFFATAEAALADLPDGATVMIGGFGCGEKFVDHGSRIIAQRLFGTFYVSRH